MNNLNWEQEHQRFVTIAYDRTQKAAKRAFYGWHESKRPDAIAECLGKMWDQWSRLLLRGRNPEPMTAALIKYAILWVRYDRKIGGRSRNPDVYDYRGVSPDICFPSKERHQPLSDRVVRTHGSIGL